MRSPGERAPVCRRCHAPSLLLHPPQSASAGLLAGHRPCPIGFDGPSSAAKAWSSRERGWVRLMAANREAAEGWLLAFWARRHRTRRRAGSRLAVGSCLGPGPGRLSACGRTRRTALSELVASEAQVTRVIRQRHPAGRFGRPRPFGLDPFPSLGWPEDRRDLWTL